MSKRKTRTSTKRDPLSPIETTITQEHMAKMEADCRAMIESMKELAIGSQNEDIFTPLVKEMEARYEKAFKRN